MTASTYHYCVKAKVPDEPFQERYSHGVVTIDYDIKAEGGYWRFWRDAAARLGVKPESAVILSLTMLP